MCLLYTASPAESDVLLVFGFLNPPIVAGGCEEDGFISVGLIEQPFGEKGGVVVGVVVEAVPDGRLE